MGFLYKKMSSFETCSGQCVGAFDGQDFSVCLKRRIVCEICMPCTRYREHFWFRQVSRSNPYMTASDGSRIWGIFLDVPSGVG